MPAALRWHGQAALQVPDNVTLLPLPPCSPEFNPVERVWLYLRERFLSFRLYRSEQAIVDGLCAAWNVLRDETGRLTTLTSYTLDHPNHQSSQQISRLV